MLKHLATSVVVMLMLAGTPVFAAAAAAGAATGALPGAQNISPAPKGSQWIALVIALVLIIGIVVASFMNAKRSHQD